MAIPPNSAGAGSPVEVTHETLQAAATSSLPEQRTQLGNTRRNVTAREVPATAFSELGEEASAGHSRNITDIAGKLDDARERVAAVIQGVGDTTRKFKAFDEDQAGRQQEQNVQLVAARKQQQSSPNGWPVDPALKTRTVPGSGTRMTMAAGPAGDLLNHVAGQLHQRVESIDIPGPPDDPHNDGGYNNRNVRGSSTTISNHASGTAFDFNSDLHRQHASGTFTPAQVGEIRTILGEVDGVVRWGGDFSARRIDEMHFEINASPAAVSRVWDRIRHQIENTP